MEVASENHYSETVGERVRILHTVHTRSCRQPYTVDRVVAHYPRRGLLFILRLSFGETLITRCSCRYVYNLGISRFLNSGITNVAVHNSIYLSIFILFKEPWFHVIKYIDLLHYKGYMSECPFSMLVTR